MNPAMRFHPQILSAVIFCCPLAPAISFAATRYVSLDSPNPTPPYSDWSTAATNIQDAIEAASAGDTVLVTNGVYATGGKAMVADLTNRVALDKALTVASVNGYLVTTIQGAWDPISTNGPLAVRCAWLTNGAVLRGFTLQGGAVRFPTNTIVGELQDGGGAWCSSVSALISECRIVNNAARDGGGVYQGSLDRCILSGNTAVQFGGGANRSTLTNSLITWNYSALGGGGGYRVFIYNCTVTFNKRGFGGAGSGIENFSGGGGLVRNSIIYNNDWPNNNNYSGGTAQPAYSCIWPPQSGTGNISSDPQLLDDKHIATTSPCRNTASLLYVSGLDIDGEPWTASPSMGCDQVLESALTGPLAVGLLPNWPFVVVNRSMGLLGQTTGRVSRVEWNYGDGTNLTNVSQLGVFHSWTSPGDYVVTFTAYNADHPAGVSTNVIVQVVPLIPVTLLPAGLSQTNFSLSFTGQPGVSYVVEQTTNLSSPIIWVTVKSVFSTGNLIEITDTKATNSARFYRARVQ